MNNDTNVDDLFFYLLIGLIIFFAIAIIVMLIKQSNRKSKPSNNFLKSIEDINGLKDIMSYSTSQSIVDPEIIKENIKAIILNTKDTIPIDNESNVKYTISSSDSINTFYENPPEPSIFFMKYPTENSFSANFQSNSIANTIYKFYLSSNKIEATYEIHTEAVPIQEIISMVEKAIKSGCDEENIPDSYTKSIRTLTPGKVKLENNKWIITNKALIRYE